MMYMVGADLIHQLRRELADRKPDTFDLRRFHDRLLSYGSVPVALVSAAMRKARVVVSSQKGRPLDRDQEEVG